MITQFILWILPPILYFLLVRFFRKNVEDPFIPRAAYWFTPLFMIPVAGLVFMSIILILLFIAVLSGCFDFNEDSNFYKKWIEK